jgi:CheY-like chemotaxis protein
MAIIKAGPLIAFSLPSLDPTASSDQGDSENLARDVEATVSPPIVIACVGERGMDYSLDHFEQRLRNRRILVVEDEASTVVMIESGLVEVGCRVHLAQDVRRAHRFATARGIDCALLDIRIGDDTVFPVADLLTTNNVPIVFSSGYTRDTLPERYQNHTILVKPYLLSDLVPALVVAMNPADPGDRDRYRVANSATTGNIHASKPESLHRYQDIGPSGRPTGKRGVR